MSPSHMVQALFKLLLFYLTPGVSTSIYKPFNISISVPYSPLGLLAMSPLAFQSLTFWGIVSLWQVPRVEVSDVGPEPLTLQGGALDL